MNMQPSEKAHSIDIANQLVERDENHPYLLAAALLHDVGKSNAPLRTWERAAVVIGQQFFPGTAQRWGRTGSANGWKRAFVVGERHPEWGAEMAAKAGAAELTVALIQRHQEAIHPVTKEQVAAGRATLEDYLLYQLQSVDRDS